MNLPKSHQLQAILSVFNYLLVYLILIAASWIYTGSYYIHFFVEDCLRILKVSLWILATWRLLFLIEYELARILRAFLVGAYLFSLSNIITQCLRYTNAELSFFNLTLLKVIFFFIPVIIYAIKRLWDYYKKEKLIIKNMRMK